MLAWMNVMLQPCVMAMNVSAESAAMPGMHQEHGQHSQHATHTDHQGDRVCPQCVADVSPEQEPCDAVLMEDCGSLSDYNNDGRSSEPKPKDATAMVAIVSPIDQTDFSAAPRSISPRYFDKPLFSSGPTLNVRFCVYLK